jgi:DNA topoisomerase I
LEEKKQSVSKKDLEEATDEVCEKCGQPMVIKIGRFGKFLACSGFPKCKNTKPHNSNGNNSEADAEIEDLGACPDCGKPLIKRRSRFGEFIGCSGYPACKYIKKEKQKHEKTGIKCPKCEKGELISKRTRRGKIFYACSRYPDCDQAYWNKPTGDKCEHCASMITETPKGLRKCENKVCPGQAKKKKENS